MNIQSYFRRGETSLLLNGVVGTLDGLLQCPVESRADLLAILGHPHPLYGGTMNNKVVTTLARVFQELNIPSLRVNFRGVGLSQGSYDAGLGESEDLLYLMRQFQETTPNLRFCLAGFSFGSYVTYRVAAQMYEQVKCLVSVAPAVQHYDFTEFKPLTLPWVVIQGEEDDTALPEAVYDWHSKLEPQPQLIKMPETGHFFHSRLGDLKNHLLDALSPIV